MKKLTVLLIVCLAVITTSYADENKQNDDYRAKVTEHHKFFQAGVGEWKLEQKMWMDPTKEPMIATGTSICKSILDGRATTVHVETTSAMGTFKGFGVFTWNGKDKKYECSWVDVYSHYGLDSMEGTHDSKTNVTTWTSKMIDPMTGTEMDVSMIEKYPNEDTMVSEFYVHINGSTIKTMENTYTRIKKSADKADSAASATVEITPEPEPAEAPEKK
ncbi:DUF1579 family protein [Candidatus Uabimicrobium sp. HlEnr_7]|uniref:DUF1579 family protein n=1 Tax=Candidatus Uabimicrobium helgolandensis TaxID=3095367 RepID=UPI003558A87D